MTPRASPQGSDAARLASARALAAEGARAVPQLVNMLDDPSWSVRREVVQALANLGDAAVAALCSCLVDQRDDEARIAATVDALVAAHGEQVDSAVIGLAQHENPAVLADVAQILGRRRSSAGNETLARFTEHSDDNVAVNAIEALGRLGGRAAVDALIACVSSQIFFRIFPAIDVLGRSGDPRALEPLSKLLNDSRYALEAARALGRTGDRRAAHPLLGLLSASSENTVRVACSALVELVDRHAQLYGSAGSMERELRERGSETVVRRLAQSVAKADRHERIAICRLLGLLRRDSASPILLSLLDVEPEVAEAAGKALLEIGRASESALFSALVEGDAKRRQALLPVVVSAASIDAVLTCLADASPDVRVRACEALARVSAVAAVPALFELLHDENQRVVHAAVGAIQALGTAETAPLALAAAGSETSGVRRAALRVLAYFGYEGALPFFEAAVRGGDPRARDIALQGLALLELPAARALLLNAAESQEVGCRAAAMRALGELERSEPVVAALRAGLGDADAWVRYYACQALGKLRVAGLEDEIRAMLADEAGQVRVAAIEALSHVSSARSIATLREFADHADVDLRRAALLGLGLTKDDDSLPALSAAAQHADSATRLVAISALASLASPGATRVLAAAASDALEAVRVAAINLLAERPGRDAADALVQLLLIGGDRELLLAALAAPLEGRIAALQAALEPADDDSALLLVSCLSRSQAEGAGAALYQTLAVHNPAVRKAGVSALAALGTQEARSAIQQIARSDPDPAVRRTSVLLSSP